MPYYYVLASLKATGWQPLNVRPYASRAIFIASETNLSLPKNVLLVMTAIPFNPEAYSLARLPSWRAARVSAAQQSYKLP